uniref:Uncharacterized protein n=1 Tax=Glossina palpalis gambiensis TaxID=67801 RepID=A0A1B0B5Q2_9MUSC
KEESQINNRAQNELRHRRRNLDADWRLWYGNRGLDRRGRRPPYLNEKFKAVLMHQHHKLTLAQDVLRFEQTLVDIVHLLILLQNSSNYFVIDSTRKC